MCFKSSFSIPIPFTILPDAPAMPGAKASPFYVQKEKKGIELAVQSGAALGTHQFEPIA